MLSFQVLSAAAILSDLYNTNSKPAAKTQWFVQLLQQLQSFEKCGSSENKIIYFLFFKRYEKTAFFFNYENTWALLIEPLQWACEDFNFCR